MSRPGRITAALLLVGLVVVGSGWLRSPRRRPPPEPAPVRLDARAPRPAAPTEAPAEPDPAPTFETHIAEVRAACDLPLEVRCDGARCAALVDSPDLDHLTGWLVIARERPRLVLSTVLRDAGVDPSRLPCGRALDRLGERPIYSVTDPESGADWWCTGSAAMCDELVGQRTGAPFDGFTATEPRRLRFRRP